MNIGVVLGSAELEVIEIHGGIQVFETNIVLLRISADILTSHRCIWAKYRYMRKRGGKRLT